MKYLRLAIPSIIFIFLILAALGLPDSSATVTDQTCKSRATKTRNGYRLLENYRRCEGMIAPDAASSDFRISSFSVGKLTDSKTLSLRVPVPSSNSSHPILRIQSSQDYYQLDPLQLKSMKDHWHFEWSNKILKQEEIPFSSIRGIAEIGSKTVLFPIVFQKSDGYDIQVYTGDRSRSIELKIIQASNGKEVYRKPLVDQKGPEVSFQWPAKTAPPGRYIIEVKALVERQNNSPQNRTITRQFEHDPKWLQ